MLNLAVLNSLVLLGDVLQEPRTVYTDCSLLNKIEGIDLPVRLYSKGERIETADNSERKSAVGVFTKSIGVFVDEKLAELPTMALLHFGRLTIEVLGVAGSLALLYQEFKNKVPPVLRQYIQMYDPLEVYRLYAAITTDERDSYDDYIQACFGWSSDGTCIGNLGIVEAPGEMSEPLVQNDSESNVSTSEPQMSKESHESSNGGEDETFDWYDSNGGDDSSLTKLDDDNNLDF